MNGQAENIDVSQAAEYTPTSAKSFDDWYKENYAHVVKEGVFGDIVNFFTGDRDVAKRGYDNYLQNLNAENQAKAAAAANKASKDAADLAYQRELQATQSAREWDKMMSDTQYQRAVADLKKAGLNPWLALQNGVSGSNVPNSGKANATAAKVTTAKGSQYERLSKEKNANSMRDISLLLFAIARLAGV